MPCLPLARTGIKALALEEPLCSNSPISAAVWSTTEIRTADVTYRPVLAAIEDLPRERFLPEAAKPFAYSDQHLVVGRVEATGESRYSLAPVLLARMVQALEPVQGERVLHVACGTGYGSAIFAELGAQVVALDEDAALIARRARASATAGFRGVKTRVGTLFEVLPPEPPST